MSAHPQFDLLCVGLTTLDIIGWPITHIPSEDVTTLIRGVEIVPAGTAGGAAMVAANLGLKTGLISAIGRDNVGDIVATQLARAGVDVRWVDRSDSMGTSTTILTIGEQGQRPAFHALGAALLMTLSETVIEAARRARFVHWGGVGAPTLDGGPGAEFLAAARKAGAVITCDLIAPQPTARQEIARLLPYVDYFLPSAAEARFLTGKDDLADAAGAFLDQGAGACVIKDGPRGVLLARPGEAIIAIPAFEVEVVDTTSCGDSLCAGFITGLSKGWPIEECCRLGVAVAGLVAQAPGTLGKLNGLESALELLKAAPIKKLTDGN